MPVAPIPQPIRCSKLLLVEGVDDFEFFLNLLRFLQMDKQLEIRNFDGVDRLSSYLKTLPAVSGFAQVEAVGIGRDADDNPAAAFQSVCAALKNNQMPVPRRLMSSSEGYPCISIFVRPNCADAGMLEMLCLASVSEETDRFDCVEQFLECVDHTVGLPKNRKKARLHAYLATRQWPDLSFKQASSAGYWPWDHPAFDQIKAFLSAL